MDVVDRDNADAQQSRSDVDIRSVGEDDGALEESHYRPAHDESNSAETTQMDLVRQSARSRTKPVFFDPSAEASKRPRVEGTSRKKPDQGKKKVSGAEQSQDPISVDFNKLKEQVKDEVMQSLELRDGTKTWLCSPGDIAAAIAPFLKKSALKSNSTLESSTQAFEGLAKAFKDVVLQSLIDDVGDALLPQILDKVNDHLQSAVPKVLETGSRADYYAKKSQVSSASASNPAPVPKERTFFKQLSDALSVYRTLLSPDKVLIADEYLPKGQRRFGVFTTKELFDGASAIGTKACFYEVIPVASPCKLFFDIDVKEKDVFADDFKFLSNSRKEILAAVQESVTSYFQQHYQLIAPPEMVVLSGCRQGKISFHVVFNVMFPTLEAVKAAVKDIVDDVAAFEADQRNNISYKSVLTFRSTERRTYETIFDSGCYQQNQNFRVWNSSKLGKASPLTFFKCGERIFVTFKTNADFMIPGLEKNPEDALPVSASDLDNSTPSASNLPVVPPPPTSPVSASAPNEEQASSSVFAPPPRPPPNPVAPPAATHAVEIPAATLQRVLKTMKKHTGYSGGVGGVRVKGYDTTVVISPKTENCFCVIAGEVHQGPRCPIYFVWPEDTDVIYQKCQKCKDKISDSFTLVSE
ncbi:hypothetical protein HDU96_001591 [Phlyctochytrium bullatum]|nr:hypothetical protein HDU96_001591 [Phlyctochytrium bullatum]